MFQGYVEKFLDGTYICRRQVGFQDYLNKDLLHVEVLETKS